MSNARLLPATPSGQWAGGLLAVAVVLVVLRVAIDGFLDGPDPTWLAGAGTVTFALVVAAAAAGAWAVVRARDRSVVVYLAIAAGILALVLETVEALA